MENSNPINCDKCFKRKRENEMPHHGTKRSLADGLQSQTNQANQNHNHNQSHNQNHNQSHNHNYRKYGGEYCGCAAPPTVFQVKCRE